MQVSTESKPINGRLFIEDYLIKRVGSIVKTEPYFGFTLIGVGIETLGAFIESEGFHVTGRSPKRFEKAIKRLFDSKYVPYTQRIYASMRCGLAHITKPKEDIFLCGEGSEARHLQEENSVLIISLRLLYDDYVSGANKLISMIDQNDPIVDQAKLGEFLTETYTVVEDSVTGKLESHTGTGDTVAVSSVSHY
jgi:hypothetical protein